MDSLLSLIIVDLILQDLESIERLSRFTYHFILDIYIFVDIILAAFLGFCTNMLRIGSLY